MSTAEKKDWIDLKKVNDESSFQEVFRALEITGLVFDGVEHEFKGNCPLHDKEQKDKKRFWASDERGLWKCYECFPKGGNVLEFVKLFKGVKPMEAAEWLMGLKKDLVREQPEEIALSLVSSLEKVKMLLEVRKQS
jgi:hypothetical protein